MKKGLGNNDNLYSHKKMCSNETDRHTDRTVTINVSKFND